MVSIVGKTTWMLYKPEEQGAHLSLIESSLRSSVFSTSFVVRSQLETMYEEIAEMGDKVRYDSVVTYVTKIISLSSQSSLDHSSSMTLIGLLDDLGYDYCTLLDTHIQRHTLCMYGEAELTKKLRAYIRNANNYQSLMDYAREHVDEYLDDILYYGQLHQWLLKEYNNENRENIQKGES